MLWCFNFSQSKSLISRCLLQIFYSFVLDIICFRFNVDTQMWTRFFAHFFRCFRETLWKVSTLLWNWVKRLLQTFSFVINITFFRYLFYTFVHEKCVRSIRTYFLFCLHFNFITFVVEINFLLLLRLSFLRPSTNILNWEPYFNIRCEIKLKLIKTFRWNKRHQLNVIQMVFIARSHTVNDSGGLRFCGKIG